MVSLGQYADTVLSAYAVSILLLGLLVWISLRQAKRAKTWLHHIEALEDKS